MNNYKFATGILLSAFVISSTAQAESYLSGFSSKLFQGLNNMGTGFIELPKNIINISHEHTVFAGITWGLVRGVAHGVSRTLVGGAEFLTSPIPSSEFVTPPYVWERFSEDTRYFGLHYPGYWTSYGPLDDGD